MNVNVPFRHLFGRGVLSDEKQGFVRDTVLVGRQDATVLLGIFRDTLVRRKVGMARREKMFSTPDLSTISMDFSRRTNT